MPLTLAQLVKRLKPGIKRKLIPLGRIEVTKALADPYIRDLQTIPAVYARWAPKILDAYAAAVAARQAALASGARHDAAGDIGDELDGAGEEARRLVVTLGPKMRHVAVAIDQWHQAQWMLKIRAATSIDAKGIIGVTGTSETIDAFYQRNLGLISSIDDQTRQRIGDLVWQGYSDMTPRDKIAGQISEAIDMGRRRARRIAVDQTTKLAAALDQQRQRGAGITKYRWRHSRKLHPRLEHVARDGKTFSWDKPPADGPPGTLPFCGCHAEALLDLGSEDDDE